MKSKPITELRYGRVRAAVWQNQGKSGGSYKSVSFSRLYKTEDCKWADSTSFSKQDLLVLAQLAEKVFATLCEDSGDDLGSDDQETGDRQ